MESEYKDPYKPLELHKLKKNKHVGIHCPNCETPTPADNLNIQDKIAKCSSCDSVFSFEDTLVSLVPKDSTPDLKKPQGIEVIQLNDEIEFSRSAPYGAWPIIGAFSSPFFALISIGIYSDKGHSALLYAAVLFFGMMLYSVYRLVQTRIEKIYITIDKSDLHVMRRPNNVKFDKSYPVREIEQIFIKPDTTEGGWSLFIVQNKHDGQKHEKIMGRFTDYGKAKYMEQEIEKYLGIENRKVIGEV